MYKKLVQIGLSESESKIYLFLLKNENQTASVIASKVGLNRSVVYSYLEKLQNKGLVSFVLIDGKRHFFASDPKLLSDFLEDKQQILKEILPKLSSLKKEQQDDFSVEVFQGLKGGIAVLKDILRTGKNYVSFGYDGSFEKTSKTIVEQYTRQLIEKGIRERIIANKGVLVEGNLKNSEIKYLPGFFENNTITTVYGNKVILTIFQKEIYNIMITSKFLAKTYANLFEYLWKIAKK